MPTRARWRHLPHEKLVGTHAMSVYRPTYVDKKTGEVKQQKVWWYSFIFAGRKVQESSKSTRKTIAVDAEKRRRMELERTYNGIEDRRGERIRTLSSLADEFLASFQARHPKSATFAGYAVGHIKRVIGTKMVAEVDDLAVKKYQVTRLGEKAAPKSINEETGFLLRILGEQGDSLRLKLRRQKALKLPSRPNIAKAFTEEEITKMLTAAKARRSPSIYPALMLALHAGMRDAEIRGLQWGRVDLVRKIVTVGDSKTEAGEGRTIPLNEDILAALVDHAKWFLKRFGETRPQWFVFPAGKPQPTDPTKAPTSFKTVWARVRKDAGVEGRWHDARHTFITGLAESGEASDGTIRELAGHTSAQMLKHYSHIGMEAKRRAVKALTKQSISEKPVPETQNSPEPPKESTKVDPVN